MAKTITFTDDELLALAGEFPRVQMRHVRPDTPLARALKKLVPQVLPQSTRRDTPLIEQRPAIHDITSCSMCPHCPGRGGCCQDG